MMMTARLPPDATLAEVLSHRARNTPTSRLVIDIAGGFAIAALTVWARPTGWVALTSAALCFAAYGAWGWVDRSLSAQLNPIGDSAIRRWRMLQQVVAVIGLGAFVLFLMAVLGIALGKFIS
ncbi:MAG: hypothetical protein P3A28_06175 [Gemmatimonadota bacterium]|nr:hypothetical protein [Gemmatimonadota bacterium]